MAKVVITVISVSQRKWLQELPSIHTTKFLYEYLEDAFHEVGYLTDEAGKYMKPEEDCVLGPGNYTFQLAGKLGTTKAGRCSMDVLLRAPLPKPKCTRTLGPILDGGPPQSTHPTIVMEWPGWEAEVKANLKRPKTFRPNYYQRTDEALAITDENDAASLLLATACQRINSVYAIDGDQCSFSIHPSKRPFEGANGEQHRARVQLEAEEEVQGRPPDICLIETVGTVPHILQTTSCKPGCQLMNMHDMSMPAIWNAVKDGHPVPDLDTARYVVDAIAQELGHMSRRGHKAGIISSYHTTWLLKTDGKGCVWISDPIAYDCAGTQDRASVTEVFLFSAFYNIEDVYKAPYPTAKHPGELPSMLHFNASKMQAQAALLPRHLAYDKQIEVERVAVKTSKCKRLRVAQRPALVPFEMLHLTTRLGPWVFLGSVCGTVAAVRLATRDAAIEKAVLEAKVYEQLQHLQGLCVPRLLNHGFTLEGKGYFVATEFLVGTAWDFESPSREAFFPKLRSAMDLVHAAGIMHNPRVTHGSNILIAPDKHVFVLDFAEALLNPTDKALKEEMTRIGYGQP